VQYVNGGHPGMIHVTADGVREHEKTGMVLGVVGGQVYPVSAPVPLSPGVVLFLRTDGIDEAMSPQREPFGERRLMDLLRQLRSRSAEEILAGVEAATRAHTGVASREDDSTMVAVKLL
jgi:sigma-B regulation protein RsbU (phosphoserine phosphatase)